MLSHEESDPTSTSSHNQSTVYLSMYLSTTIYYLLIRCLETYKVEYLFFAQYNK